MALNNWRPSGTKAKPRADFTLVGSRVTSLPWNVTRPRQGAIVPAMARSIVVLPAPLAPTIAVNCPLPALSETPQSTWTSP